MFGRSNDAAAAEAAALRAEVAALREELRALAERQQSGADKLHDRVEHMHGQLLQVLQVAVDQEADMRRRLYAARAEPAYEAAFVEADPLVSVVIPSYTNFEGLRDVSVPSALAQTHENVEVIVVGDAAPPEVDEVMASFDDPRVRYENLERRGPYPDDRDGLWFTGGTPPLNRAFRMARGTWFAVLNDDDAQRPTMIESLLEVAREQRAEVAYGKLMYHEPDKPSWELGVFPPTHHQFGWQMALQHGAMRMFEYELSTHLFHEPADWNRVRRMLRTPVRFAFADEVVGDYYPRRLWEAAER